MSVRGAPVPPMCSGRGAALRRASGTPASAAHYPSGPRPVAFLSESEPRTRTPRGPTRPGAGFHFAVGVESNVHAGAGRRRRSRRGGAVRDVLLAPGVDYPFRAQHREEAIARDLPLAADGRVDGPDPFPGARRPPDLVAKAAVFHVRQTGGETKSSSP